MNSKPKYQIGNIVKWGTDKILIIKKIKCNMNLCSYYSGEKCPHFVYHCLELNKRKNRAGIWCLEVVSKNIEKIA